MAKRRRRARSRTPSFKVYGRAQRVGVSTPAARAARAAHFGYLGADRS